MLKNIWNRVNEWSKRLNPAVFFVWVAAPLGLLLCVLTPPFMVPDEQAHFARAYQVSEGGLVPERISQGIGGRLPSSITIIVNTLVGDLPGRAQNKISVDTILSQFSVPLNPQERTDTHFENTALYSPVMYAVPAVGIGVGRVVGLPPLALLYVGRIFTLLTAVIIIYAAIRLIPVAKWALAVIALAPMAVFQSASVSADGITLAATSIVVAWFVRLVMQAAPVTRKQWVATLCLLLPLGFMKQPYALVGFIFLMLPVKQFVTKKVRWQYMISAVVTLAIGLVLVYIMSKVFFAQSPFMVDRILQPDAQLLHVLQHPLSFLKAVVVTHISYLSDANITQLVGVFGWLDTGMPLWTTLAYLLGLFVAIGMGASQKLLPAVQSWTLVLAAGAIFIAIDALLYLYWNILKSPVIGGIQGRYYLMLLPMLAVAVTGRFTVLFKKLSPQLFVMCCLGVALGTMVVVIGNRFYL